MAIWASGCRSEASHKEWHCSSLQLEGKVSEGMWSAILLTPPGESHLPKGPLGDAIPDTPKRGYRSAPPAVIRLIWRDTTYHERERSLKSRESWCPRDRNCVIIGHVLATEKNVIVGRHDLTVFGIPKIILICFCVDWTNVYLIPAIIYMIDWIEFDIPSAW